jgi:four helix bundle protein
MDFNTIICGSIGVRKSSRTLSSAMNWWYTKELHRGRAPLCSRQLDMSKRIKESTRGYERGHQMIKTFKDLIVYQKAFEQAMEIFELTKSFPRIEKYSLTDQIRRSSRSVCVNIGEAWRRLRYPAHFVSKLTDADAEATETVIWLDFSLACRYLNPERYKKVSTRYEEIGKILGSMVRSPEKFCYETAIKSKV